MFLVSSDLKKKKIVKTFFKSILVVIVYVLAKSKIKMLINIIYILLRYIFYPHIVDITILRNMSV